MVAGTEVVSLYVGHMAMFISVTLCIYQQHTYPKGTTVPRAGYVCIPYIMQYDKPF
jgi:hypothetical protein